MALSRVVRRRVLRAQANLRQKSAHLATRAKEAEAEWPAIRARWLRALDEIESERLRLLRDDGDGDQIKALDDAEADLRLTLANLDREIPQLANESRQLARWLDDEAPLPNGR